MFDEFDLAVAVTRGRRDTMVYRVPMSADLQSELSAAWYERYAEASDRAPISFDPGYDPDETQIFVIEPFVLPDWLHLESGTPLRERDIVPNEERTFALIRCVFAYARDANSGISVFLFQNFTRSRVIKPSWRSMVFYRDVYQTSERYGFQLGDSLSAVFVGPSEGGRLLFSKLREVSTYLPMDEHYREATADEIRQILQHDALLVDDPGQIIDMASPWYARRFAMLRDTGILDRYEPAQLQSLATNVDVQLDIQNNRIRLPADRANLRTVLTFLNEERFRGPITEGLFEANSKRRVGA